jgi:chromosome partitioning protein
MIISFVNQKGGVGKTTTAVNLGSCLIRKNHTVILLDLDPQGSAARWHAVEGNLAFGVIHQPTHLVPSDLEKLSSTYDFVIIDSPPTMDGITWKILAASNMVIIPVSPSSLDLWACTDTLKMIKEVRQQHPDLTAKFLINRKIPGTRAGREIRQALATFKTQIFNTELCQRVSYVDALKYGVSVMQYAPGRKAAAEIEQFCDELLNNRLETSEPIESADVTPITSLFQEESDNSLFGDYQAL